MNEHYKYLVCLRCLFMVHFSFAWDLLRFDFFLFRPIEERCLIIDFIRTIFIWVS